MPYPPLPPPPLPPPLPDKKELDPEDPWFPPPPPPPPLLFCCSEPPPPPPYPPPEEEEPKAEPPLFPLDWPTPPPYDDDEALLLLFEEDEDDALLLWLELEDVLPYDEDVVFELELELVALPPEVVEKPLFPPLLELALEELSPPDMEEDW